MAEARARSTEDRDSHSKEMTITTWIMQHQGTLTCDLHKDSSGEPSNLEIEVEAMGPQIKEDEGPTSPREAGPISTGEEGGGTRHKAGVVMIRETLYRNLITGFQTIEQTDLRVKNPTKLPAKDLSSSPALHQSSYQTKDL